MQHWWVPHYTLKFYNQYKNIAFNKRLFEEGLRNNRKQWEIISKSILKYHLIEHASFRRKEISPIKRR
jgi:hypothetical protein